MAKTFTLSEVALETIAQALRLTAELAHENDRPQELADCNTALAEIGRFDLQVEIA